MKKNNYDILSEIELKMPPTKVQTKEMEKALREYESVRFMESVKRHNKLVAEREYKAIRFPSFP